MEFFILHSIKLTKTKAPLLLVLLLLLGSVECVSQNRVIDSVKNFLKTAPHDTIAIQAYNELCYEYMRIDSDTSLYYASLAKKKSEELNYPLGIAKANHSMALAYYAQSDYLKSLEFFNKATEFYDSLGQENRSAAVKNNLGVIYRKLGDHKNSLKAHYESLEIRKRLGNPAGQSTSYINLGSVYSILGQYDSALNNNLKALKLKQDLKDSSGIARVFNNLGLIKYDLKEYENARDYYQKAIEIRLALNDKKGLASTYNNVGTIHLDLEEYDEAKQYFEESLDLYNQVSVPIGQSVSLKWLGVLNLKQRKLSKANHFLEQSLSIKKAVGEQLGLSEVYTLKAEASFLGKNNNEAIDWAKKGLELAASLEARIQAKEASKILHEIYLSQKEYENAYKYLGLYHTYEDSILNEQKIIEIARIESQLSMYQLKLENEQLWREQMVAKSELQSQQIRITSLVTGLILTIVVALIWYGFNKQKQRTIVKLEELNSEIRTQKEMISEQAEELQAAYEEISLSHESLKESVNKRTEKIKEQNEKLQGYAYTNSHRVRGPLTRLLGLARLMDMKALSTQEKSEFSKKLVEAGEELDHIVKNINELLKTEDFSE